VTVVNWNLLVTYHASELISSRSIMFSGLLFVCLSVCPSVNTCFARCDISLLSDELSIKVAMNIHHVNENCRIGFQGQKSQLKVICKQICECYNGRSRTASKTSRCVCVGYVWIILLLTATTFSYVETNVIEVMCRMASVHVRLLFSVIWPKGTKSQPFETKLR